MNRNLDDVCFRIQRDGKYQSICFSDLTEDEREALPEKTSLFWRSLAYHLADCLKEIGEQFDIMRDEE